MASKEDFVKNIQKWVAIDTQLHELNEKTKKLREMKKEINASIHSHVSENHMEKTVINITDGELRFCEKKEYGALTLGYIEKCLQDSLIHRDIATEQNIANIMARIRQQRGIKVVKDITRNYKEKNV